MAVDDAAPSGELTADGADEAGGSLAEPGDQRSHTHDATEPVVNTEDGRLAGRSAAACRSAMVAGLIVVVVLATLTGWLGFRAYQSHQSTELRSLFLQVGRQGAINLTTIDSAEADADVRRILDSATGPFHDDFSKRSQPFVDVVKHAQSKSVGTVTAAGIESESGDAAQVLVAVAVKTSVAGGTAQEPRAWRMLMSIQKVGGQAKISDVQFVP